MKKTIKVTELKDNVNRMLAESTCSPEGRETMCTILERVLMDTGNYNGFRYLIGSEVPVGELPGICHSETSNYYEWFPKGKFDSSRRSYF